MIPLRDSLIFSYPIFFLMSLSNYLTNEYYANMIFVYGFCDGNELQILEEYHRRYPRRRIPIRHTILSAFQSLRDTRSVWKDTLITLVDDKESE